MAGHSALRDERINTSIRFRRSTRRAVDELAALLGGLSRDDTVELALREGLAVFYERLGIKTRPELAAAELLRVIGGTWETDLSDDEVDAFAIAQDALRRLTQLQARAAGEMDAAGQGTEDS